MKTTQKHIAVMSIWRDRATKGIQLCIEDESGSGFRIMGPKFRNCSDLIESRQLTERDAKEIRQYLDAAFPLPSPTAFLDEALNSGDGTYRP